MTFFEFVRKYNGKQVDVDSSYGYQCVDLMRKYCEEVLNLSLYSLPGVLGAGDLWNKVPDNHPNFKKLKNWPWAVPQQGDIILWGRSKKLPYGHVAIVNTADLWKISSFDQNWDGKQRCAVVDNHNYSGCQGWLRKR